MSGYQLAVRTPDRAAANAIAGVLAEAIVPPPDALSVFAEVDAWLVEAFYAQGPPDAVAVAGQLADILAIAPPICHVSEVPDANWVTLSQAALPPVSAGRFTVFGDHDRANVARGPNAIMIDAGEAFGTAHHATTYGCLEAIDRLTRRQSFDRILDLGTGSGVLAVALARVLPQADILATDVDRLSVEIAADNARINACQGLVGARLRFRAARGLSDAVIRSAAPFDLIVANILAGPLITLAGPITAATRPGARLVLSGILVGQAAAVVATYVAHGFAVASHQRIEGWSTLVLTKRA